MPTGHSVHQEQQVIPGFTAEQNASFQALLSAQISAMNEAMMQEMKRMTENINALGKQFGLQPIPLPAWPQQSTPPTPQEAPKEQAISEEEAEITAEKQEPLYQATVEDDPEHSNSMLTKKSTLSSFSCLCTTPASRDPAACLSKAPLSAFISMVFLAPSTLDPGR